MKDRNGGTQWPVPKGPPPDDYGRLLPCGCDPETGIDCDAHLKERVDRSASATPKEGT